MNSHFAEVCSGGSGPSAILAVWFKRTHTPWNVIHKPHPHAHGAGAEIMKNGQCVYVVSHLEQKSLLDNNHYYFVIYTINQSIDQSLLSPAGMQPAHEGL